MNRFAATARRLVQGVLVVLAAASLVFVAIRLVPGDPIDSILGEQALSVDRDALRACMRLDLPLPLQYARFLGDIVDTSLGRFCDDPSRIVRDELTRAIGPTVVLALLSMLLSIGIALPLGSLAALYRDQWPDRVAIVWSTLGIALPVFVSGPLLLVGFSLGLRSLPGDPHVWFAAAQLVLPALALGLALSARLLRVTRASVLEIRNEPWVAAARARGLTERAVAMRHIVRNALVPVVVAAGSQLGAMLAGAVVAERIFARPGLGTLLLEAIDGRNFALVQGCVVVMAAGAVLANLLADMATAALDPRTQDAP